MSPRIPLTFSALAIALTLAACSPSPSSADPSTPSPASSGGDASTAASTAPMDTQTPGAEPTCETIVTPGTVEALTSQGWTAKQQDFQIGETLLDGGLVCMWADFTTASDHGQMYGWGPLDARESQNAQTSLQRDGWLRSTDGDIVYFTEDPDYAIAKDDDGFGMTYEFGDGWVKFSDTKQGLLLIEWKG